MESRVVRHNGRHHEDSSTGFPGEVQITSELCKDMLSEFYSFDLTREELLIHLWTKLRDYYWTRKDAGVISKQSWGFVLNFKIVVDTTDYEDAKALFEKFDNDSMFRTSYTFNEEDMLDNTFHYTLAVIAGKYSEAHSLVSRWYHLDAQVRLDFRHSLGFLLNGDGGKFYLMDNMQEIRRELTSVHNVRSYRSDGDMTFEMVDPELLVLSKNYRDGFSAQLFLISVDIPNSRCTFLCVNDFSVRIDHEIKFVFDVNNRYNFLLMFNNNFHVVGIENREMQFSTNVSNFNINPVAVQLNGKILRALLFEKDAEIGKYGFFDLNTGSETLVFNERSDVNVQSISDRKIWDYSWLKSSCYMIFQTFSCGRFELYVFDNERLNIRPILFRSVMDKTFSSFHIDEEEPRLTIACKRGNRFYNDIEVFQFPLGPETLLNLSLLSIKRRNMFNTNVLAMLPVNLTPFYQLPLNQPPLNQPPLEQDPVNVNPRKRPLSESD